MIILSLLVIGYLLWTLTNFGLLYEGTKSAWPVELIRWAGHRDYHGGQGDQDDHQCDQDNHHNDQEMRASFGFQHIFTIIHFFHRKLLRFYSVCSDENFEKYLQGVRHPCTSPPSSRRCLARPSFSKPSPGGWSSLCGHEGFGHLIFLIMLRMTFSSLREALIREFFFCEITS